MAIVNIPIADNAFAHFLINNVLMFLATIIVVLRLVSRRLRGNTFGLDDWFIIGAVPPTAGMLTIQGLFARLGTGHNIKEVPLDNVTRILQLLIAYQLIYATTLLMIKLSILCFYLRVFVNDHLRLASKVVMVVTVLWSIGNLLQVFLLCRPFRLSWDFTVPGECGDRTGSYIAIGAFNSVTDFIILTLPIPTVWRLQMPRSGKLALTGVFCIGLLVSIIAIIRMVTLAQIDFTNLTETMAYPSFWSTTEPVVAIICVCLPMLRPVMARVWPSRFRSNATVGYKQSTQSSSPKSFERLHENSESYSINQLYVGNRGMKGEAACSSYPADGSMTSLNTPAQQPDFQNSSEQLTAPVIATRKEWEVTRSPS